MTETATQRAATLYDAGAYRLALDEAARALSTNPEDGVALIVAAGARRELGDLRGALVTAEAAARRLPDDPRAFTQLALCRSRAGDYLGAEGAARDLIRLRPDSASSFVLLADVLNHSPHAAWQAIAAAEEALARDPEHVGALSVIGDAYLDLRHPDRAQAAYARALAIDPEDFRARHGIARAINFGRPAAAIVRFAAMLAERPGDETILINLRAGLLRLLNRLFWVVIFTPLGGGIVLGAVSSATGPLPERPGLAPSVDVTPPGSFFTPGPEPTIIVLSSQTTRLAHAVIFDFGAYAIASLCYGLAVWIVVAILVTVTLRRVRPYTRSILLLGRRDGPLLAFAITLALVVLPLPLPFGFPVAIVLAGAALVTRRVVFAVIVQRNRVRLGRR